MEYREVTWTSQEGLRLYARDYGDRTSLETPVLCLPGLTRNSKDFHTLATHIAASGRRVLCPDLRGRGKSACCSKWTDYTVAKELQDVFDLLAAAGVSHAVFIGTSRGGLITMQAAIQRPTVIKAAILNDIGPEIDRRGIKRIIRYAGRMAAPESWEQATLLLRQMNHRHFPTVSGDEWRAFARMTFAEKDGAPALDYDARIGKGLRRAFMLSRGTLPTMWPQFRALSHVPMLLIRGEHSDLLSPEIFRKMQEIHPAAEAITIAGRGHAPFLNEAEAIAAIEGFLQERHR